ncbi:MAG TPA: branched-chain amino acid ABC transporter permease [Aminobacterium sp.]|jgi:branched-chain amino acid transport system permease protein|uniref:branched-chain amino acid ABC transporter permease n=1 Tax=Aminobacterium TaxID=81466 RepID=UPI000465DE32|nr:MULTISPECIES: branched-chain amino acid ABC transporter permease [Aminobacterium]HCA40737.1 branched-chain amino acid ABC transporter permease [Aminobacterium sp.]
MSGYTEGIIILLCINGIAAMGVSLLTGFTGVFTLGHAAYMALGAYTSAILTVHYGLHWFPAILLGGGVAVLVAYGIGVPTLRLMGDYYAIASIGLGEAIRLILENWQSLTRGARGYPGIEPYTTLPVALTFFVIMAICMFNFIKSRYGRSFKACRDDYVAASLLGLPTAKIRILSLIISAFYCGVAGALLAGFLSFIQPIMFDMLKSTELTAVVVFGGLGSMTGTLVGTVVITLVTELFRPISQYRMLIYGAVLVVIMVLRPEGIMGGLNGEDLTRKFFRRKDHGGTP